MDLAPDGPGASAAHQHRERIFQTSGDNFAVIKSIVADLRTAALKCMKLARDCSDDELSQLLQDLSSDLMARAAELEYRFDQ
jgi:hypothetical protein